VGTGIKTSIKQLAERILKVTGSNLEIEYKPGGLTFVKNRVGCPKKAETEIGFKYEKELDEGLRLLIEWRDAHKAEVDRRRQKA
jgi:UDP-glucose 4-epimerase